MWDEGFFHHLLPQGLEVQPASSSCSSQPPTSPSTPSPHPTPWSPTSRHPPCEGCCSYLSEEPLQIVTPHSTPHARHILRVHMTRCIPLTHTLSHVCTHTQKVTSREQQASDTIIFTQDLYSPTYIVTQTCTHSCIPRHTWMMHTLEIPLGIQILAPSEMPGQAGGTRGSHPGGGHGL